VSRIPLIAGNWKMHKTVAEAEAYVAGLLPRVADVDGVDVVLCVPFTALAAVVDSTRGSRVEVYAQNMHWAADGAYTGEICPAMLNELDVHGTLLGHSERRELFGETDKALMLKVPAALEAGLKPMLCVGETEEERDAGDTERKLRHQVQEGLEKVPRERLAEVASVLRGSPGSGKVAWALPRIRSGVDSRPETLLRLLCVRARLPEPVVDHAISVAGGLVLHADLAYVDARIVLDYEGDAHRVDRATWLRDLQRRELFEDAGWRVIRVTSADLFGDPDAFVARLRTLRRARIR
jgi:triosephosphate isomerase